MVTINRTFMSDIVLDALYIFSFIPQNYISFFKYEKKDTFTPKHWLSKSSS